jgi:Uma2 family endonuclease
MAVQVERGRRFTADEFERMVEAGVFRSDLAVLRPRSYFTGSPRPDDVLLVVEVAETSLRYDRTRKLRLYAAAGIAEYWVVSVGDGWIEVYRAPEGDGYRERRRAERGESVAPLAFPDVVISVADVFA